MSSEPTPMENRPKIARVTFISPEGNLCSYIVGRDTTEIRETQESGEFCFIPWLEVWDGEHLIARFNQHKVEHIIYQRGEA